MRTKLDEIAARRNMLALGPTDAAAGVVIAVGKALKSAAAGERETLAARLTTEVERAWRAMVLASDVVHESM